MLRVDWRDGAMCVSERIRSNEKEQRHGFQRDGRRFGRHRRSALRITNSVKVP